MPGIAIWRADGRPGRRMQPFIGASAADFVYSGNGSANKSVRDAGGELAAGLLPLHFCGTDLKKNVM